MHRDTHSLNFCRRSPFIGNPYVLTDGMCHRIVDASVQRAQILYRNPKVRLGRERGDRVANTAVPSQYAFDRLAAA
jgi:hypothetical protein